MMHLGVERARDSGIPSLGAAEKGVDRIDACRLVRIVRIVGIVALYIACMH